jgi:hypothetical protein
MDSLETFRKTVRVARSIENNLDNLARVVDGTETKSHIYNNLIVDLKKLFPQTDADNLAAALITEQCRVEFIKMKDASRPKQYFSGRD